MDFQFDPCLRGVLLGLLLSSAPAHGASEEVRIRLHGDTDLERRGREQLERLLRTYDLEKWLFTRDVLIQSRVIPHSHPVLTLNTRYLDDDIGQLATFVHEQLHWFLTDQVGKEVVAAAIAGLKTMYPSVPGEPPEGARGTDSTYLHLVVCHLELKALTELLGESRAREQLAQTDHYTWVYRTVLADTDEIQSTLARHGLIVPDDDGRPGRR
jgi:hypothetical protein